jgi:CheY-like chemotaxis protein
MCKAEGGYDPVEKATTLVPDLIVLNFRIPKMNGIDVASVLKLRLPKVSIVGDVRHRANGAFGCRYQCGGSRGFAADCLGPKARSEPPLVVVAALGALRR